MFSTAVWRMFAVMEISVVNTVSKVSLSKGRSLSFPSISTKLCLTSIGKVGPWLYLRKNEENCVEVCLLTLCANIFPSIILGQYQGFPSRIFSNEFLMVLFCPSQSPFDWGWYTEVMQFSVTLMLCKTLLTSLTSSLPWSLIWILNFHRHMSTYNLIKELSNGGGTFIFPGFRIRPFTKIVYTHD